MITAPIAAAAVQRSKPQIYAAIELLASAGILIPAGKAGRAQVYEAAGLLDLIVLGLDDRQRPSTRDATRTPATLDQRRNEGERHSDCSDQRRDEDVKDDVAVDRRPTQEGDACPVCGKPVILRNGIEVGNIFKLGTDFTESLDATFLTEAGERRHPYMGSYGIGLGRAMACIVEDHHDEKGIAWPVEVAPYRVHLVAIGARKAPEVTTEADALYERLTEAGISVLYDDRDESPGVKFTDAELLGMPAIVTVSPRALAAGGVEVTNRASGERSVRPIDELVAELTGP